MFNAMKRVVREFLTDEGTSPYRSWLETLDISIRARVQARVLRFEVSNLGDHKSLGDGVWEARLMFGSGYRLYFGQVGQEIVLLLLGGDKRSQTADIRVAKRYWAQFLEALKHGKAQ